MRWVKFEQIWMGTYIRVFIYTLNLFKSVSTTHGFLLDCNLFFACFAELILDNYNKNSKHSCHFKFFLFDESLNIPENKLHA